MKLKYLSLDEFYEQYGDEDKCRKDDDISSEEKQLDNSKNSLFIYSILKNGVYRV